MDRASINELYAYTEWSWNQMITTGRGAGEGTLTRVAPGSGWPDLRHCFGHIILAYGRWLPAVETLKVADLPDLEDGDLLNWDAIEEQRAQVRAKLRSLIDGWSDDELATVRDFDIDGDVMRYTRADLLAHLLIHERGHHGDVSTLFYQLGIEIPMLDYRFHLDR